MNNNESFTTETPTETAIMDKTEYGRRWRFSPRYIDNLLRQGPPHLKIGKRRVRIVVSEGDAWMKERFSTQRHP